MPDGLFEDDVRKQIEEMAVETGIKAKLMRVARCDNWGVANRLHDKIIEELVPTVKELATKVEKQAQQPVEPENEDSDPGFETPWWQVCRTDSQGKESFSWSYTFGTSFKKFREEAAHNRDLTLHLIDEFTPDTAYRLTARQLADGLRGQQLTVIVPPGPGCFAQRDALRQEHPKWKVEVGRRTRGGNTAFIRIPMEFVRKHPHVGHNSGQNL